MGMGWAKALVDAVILPICDRGLLKHRTTLGILRPLITTSPSGTGGTLLTVWSLPCAASGNIGREGPGNIRTGEPMPHLK